MYRVGSTPGSPKDDGESSTLMPRSTSGTRPSSGGTYRSPRVLVQSKSGRVPTPPSSVSRTPSGETGGKLRHDSGLNLNLISSEEHLPASPTSPSSPVNGIDRLINDAEEGAPDLSLTLSPSFGRKKIRAQSIATDTIEDPHQSPHTKTKQSRADSLSIEDNHQRRGSISQFLASVGRPRRDSVTALADSLLKRQTSNAYVKMFKGFKDGDTRRAEVEAMKMNGVSRAFIDAETEAAFGKYFFDISIRQVRFATGLAVVGVSLFAIGDELDVGLTAPWDMNRLQVLFIRIALVAAILLFYGFTYVKFFRRHMQSSLVAIFSGAGVLFAVMSLLKQSVGVVFIAIFLLFIYLVPRLRFIYASIITAIAFTAWDIVYYLIFIGTGKQDVSVFLIYNALLILCAALNMVTGYVMETYIRQDFLLKRTIEVEQEKTDGLLKNMLPASAVEKLKDGKHLIADQFQEVTVLLADVVGFTNLAAMLQPGDLVALMNEVYSRFDALADTHGVYKLETIGDAYMAVGGLPEPRADHADAMGDMALDMQKAMIGVNRPDGEPLQIRIGLHTGPVIAGVVGVNKMPRYWVWGETVLLSNRMEALGMPGKVHVSETTQRLLRRKFIMESAVLDEKKQADLPQKAGQTYFLIRRRSADVESRGTDRRSSDVSDVSPIRTPSPLSHISSMWSGGPHAPTISSPLAGR